MQVQKLISLPLKKIPPVLKVIVTSIITSLIFLIITISVTGRLDNNIGYFLIIGFLAGVILGVKLIEKNLHPYKFISRKWGIRLIVLLLITAPIVFLYGLLDFILFNSYVGELALFLFFLISIALLIPLALALFVKIFMKKKNPYNSVQ